MAPPTKKSKSTPEIGDVSVVLLQHWSQQVDDLGIKLERAENAARTMQDKYDRLLRHYREMILNMNETLYHNSQYAEALTAMRVHFDMVIRLIHDPDDVLDAVEGLQSIINRFNRNMEIDLTADTELESSDEE